MILGQETRKNFTQNPKNDILSGLTVALALVPEAVAFAFVAGVDPLVGLYGAFMMGIVTALFGGRPGMISGATGAMAVVMVHLIQKGNEVGLTMDNPVDNLGLQWLFITLLFVGGIQIMAGVFKLGKFVRLIPHPVMMGFVNGLAIVIFLAQLKLFPNAVPQEISFWNDTSGWLSALFTNTVFWKMMGFIGLTMAIMYGLPKLTKKIPAALIAIVVVACITIFGGIEMSTVGSFIREGGGSGLKGSLPTFQDQIFGLFGSLAGHWDLIISTAVILAAVGLIESLMTLNLVDEITETRGNGNRECIAQGGANILNGLFGGMGGCAMIGQSIINVDSGGRGRLSGAIAAIALLCFVLFGAPLIEQIPIAALVGVMFMVVVGTFAWSSFRIIRKIPLSDAIVLIAVSAITVWKDLAVAVIAGVIISALVFAWKNALMIRARKRIQPDGTKTYEIWGPLFFGSIQNFNSKFDVKNDPQNVEIDFVESRISDHSALEAIFNLVNKYEAEGKSIKLKHLSEDCKVLLYKASPKFKEVVIEAIDDPRYHLAADPEKFTKPLSEYNI
ncbi:SulP family inorganic anion transporter [Psychroserpens sp.]|uniref:SulP family inorganic anion transporter n=1 Tax=Psychroserpens sp. TaxID=2020870 RepID=UPI001B1B5461|nr:SulP family inorganic anion transporter [Psychroserpens sp.]MBO6607983.1 SulP family inorganic anion transporter [Psychroserpens sp.]MBO6631793.1 SulP family inorganic anion transporter [Psychroserpens sp.]MBO6654890.1 SulP family inorganic anion transporter [Psychroserpens sp.]MBO6683036.1 SulP family inorganic anion transporter [Psychroserpens sp.]MBO6751341.1 SulP family inorganic anion transporter [Psychroserpens sp.]